MEFHGASSNLDPVRLAILKGEAYLPSGRWDARGGSGALLSSLRWCGAGGRALQGGVRLLVARWFGGAWGRTGGGGAAAAGGGKPPTKEPTITDCTKAALSRSSSSKAACSSSDWEVLRNLKIITYY